MGVFALAVVVFADWMAGSGPQQITVMPSRVAMNANTATALAMAAVALWLLAGPVAAYWRRRIALGCALAVGVLGAATLSEYLFGWRLGIDQLLGSGSSVEINTTNPGRMAPETALILVLLGTALCLITRPRLVLVAQALAVMVAMVGLFNLMGYVYGAVAFYKIDHKSSIGIATAAAFVALGAGILCARNDAGLMRSIKSKEPGGVVMRRLLLAALLLPLVVGWLELVGEHAGLFNHAHGTGVAGVTGSLALMILIWRTAKVLDRSGRGRQEAEAILQQANERLKQNDRERAVLLASANKSLSQGNTEIVRMEALLCLQASALESAANAIAISDRTGRIEWVNPAFCALSGYGVAEAVGHISQELTKSARHDEAFFETMRTTILAGRVWHSEVVNRRKDGCNYTVFETITPVRDKGGEISHFISITEDITEKKILEEQALRSQRVQNLGMLSAGIAHDFNNALAPIILAAPMLRTQVSDPGAQRMLTIIEQCAERGAALVRQMLSFARGTIDHKVQVQIRHVLMEVIDIAKTTFPKSIRIKAHLPLDLWPVVGDPTQINQVFMNLLINARDAMAQGGELVITASNRTFDAAEAEKIAGARPGQFLTVEVRDSGTGIPPEVLERIWEPFFTTKVEGKGTGLGLSTARGIVHQHGGYMIVRTNCGIPSGHGTAFTVCLPMFLAANEAGDKSDPSGDPARRGEDELILVVDDEKSVRELSATILINQGYQVITASDGAEAVALFRPRAAEVRLLLTDSDMPTLGGKALIEALQRLRPDLPVLIISGEPGNHHGEPELLAATYLAKPFSAETLRVTVRRMLDEARPSVPGLALL